MYNGIGLPTARGTGTNGYVQKNASQLRMLNAKQDRPSIAAPRLRRTCDSILVHNQKREIEVKVIEYESELETHGLNSSEIENKVSEYRIRLLEAMVRRQQNDEAQAAKAPDLKAERNARFRSALGISESVREGDAFRFELKRQNTEKSDGSVPLRIENKY